MYSRETILQRTLLTLTALSQLSGALAGTARVVNNCGTTIYVASVKNNNNNAAPAPIAAGQSYSEPILAASNGVSIKVSATPGGKMTQFEYTLTTADGGKLWYDTSNIDGNPFAERGTSLMPSGGGGGSKAAFPSCVSVVCPPVGYCDAAYNLPDDVRTKACPAGSDLVFTVCTGGGSGSGNGNGNVGAAAAAQPAQQQGKVPAAPATLGVAGKGSNTAQAAPVGTKGTAAAAAPAKASPAAVDAGGGGRGQGRQQKWAA